MFEANQLSLAIWLPIIGGIAVLATGNDQRAGLARIVALLVSIATMLVTLPLYSRFDKATEDMQFIEHFQWIPALNINYSLAIDGIALLLILLTAFMNNYEFIDTDFFSDSEIEHAAKLLEDPIFQNAMKSLRSRKAFISPFIEDLINLAKDNLTAIQTYSPDVKLLHRNVGLVGNATQNNNWSKNIPLTLTNDLESIWEADVLLKNGSVKFREGNNWYLSWGGDEFPEGSTLAHYGNNIPVKTGKYRVILNLSEKTYQFIKQDN